MLGVRTSQNTKRKIAVAKNKTKMVKTKKTKTKDDKYWVNGRGGDTVLGQTQNKTQ